MVGADLGHRSGTLPGRGVNVPSAARHRAGRVARAGAAEGPPLPPVRGGLAGQSPPVPPTCGRTDHRILRYLFAEEDQGRFRLAICDACGGRLKVITTLAPLSPPGLVVAEFTMLYLDLIEERPRTGADP